MGGRCHSWSSEPGAGGPEEEEEEEEEDQVKTDSVQVTWSGVGGVEGVERGGVTPTFPVSSGPGCRVTEQGRFCGI